MPRTSRSLPAFIPPMLARPGKPFDSPDHLFEIKWDGTRTLCFIEGKACRLLNRRRIDMTPRYPEMAFLGQISPGTVLDGEMVVLRQGKPDFGLLQSREQAQVPLKIRTLSRAQPATYMVFDLLYDRFTSTMALPLLERRARLERRLKNLDSSSVVLSQGVIGPGKDFFQQAVGQDLEGVMAKRLQSPYLPGQRSGDWIKIKRGQELLCVAIGFLPSGKNDIRSIILATEDDGVLRCVGKVGTGWDEPMRQRLSQWLWGNLQSKPVIACPYKGKWVAPKLFLRVSCMERTRSGDLRAPVFQGLVEV